jgi:hypothetical protein
MLRALALIITRFLMSAGQNCQQNHSKTFEVERWVCPHTSCTTTAVLVDLLLNLVHVIDTGYAFEI